MVFPVHILSVYDSELFILFSGYIFNITLKLRNACITVFILSRLSGQTAFTMFGNVKKRWCIECPDYETECNLYRKRFKSLQSNCFICSWG